MALTARDFGPQSGVRPAAVNLVLAPEDEGVAAGGVILQQVFGVIDARLGKPAGAGHALTVLQYGVAHVAKRTAELP